MQQGQSSCVRNAEGIPLQDGEEENHVIVVDDQQAVEIQAEKGTEETENVVLIEQDALGLTVHSDEPLLQGDANLDIGAHGVPHIEDQDGTIQPSLVEEPSNLITSTIDPPCSRLEATREEEQREFTPNNIGITTIKTVTLKSNLSSTFSLNLTFSMKTTSLYLLFFTISSLFFFTVVVSIEDDIRCLRGVKDSLKDPLSVLLSSWNFGNTTAGFLCKFVGVSCWNDQEYRLIALELRSFELGGEVPASLQFCQSLQTLDLSDNALSGSIPSQLCEWLPFLVRIDLSKNQFTGSIPVELVNCKFLNSLSLGGNRLSGSIPYQLARLDRLKMLSVANNDLSVIYSVEEDDIRCLQGLKNSLKDPQSKLTSWSFINTTVGVYNTVGFLCRFVGVMCWNERENRVIDLELPSMELGGEIPDSLQFCQNLQTLNLSDNALSGSVPSQICDWIPYLVNLDLSKNSLSGPIPLELANCKYLKILSLSDNRLSGPLPYQLSRFIQDDASKTFGNNKGLCADFGGLTPCHETKDKHQVIIFIKIPILSIMG
ncbi:hypothetical protein IFM89_012991 [Coptis chinensis]|uniref:Leucine-rich repeat-containing N-terminal plant-type domain-containing protein n=1 Tax=Coptis chinensis TaxID=261450 RepID=A0A835M9M6_9MAGN|nr:hypothetical protein IFM89_012991 [Coptis chinensis]